jgi:hypothetical protein
MTISLEELKKQIRRLPCSSEVIDSPAIIKLQSSLNADETIEDAILCNQGLAVLTKKRLICIDNQDIIFNTLYTDMDGPQIHQNGNHYIITIILDFLSDDKRFELDTYSHCTNSFFNKLNDYINQHNK